MKSLNTLRRHACAALCGVVLAACGNSPGTSSAGAGNAAGTPLPEACGSVSGALLGDGRSVAPTACERASWIAGSTELCAGRLSYRDYVYDDYGASNGMPAPPPISRGPLSPSAGAQRYPAGAENTADLVNLQLWTDRGRLHIRGELNTLFKADSTVLAVAIDSDNDPATGGGAWCDLKVASQGWDVLQTLRKGNPDSNVIEGSIPLPAGSTWRVQAAVAQADGTVMNVAFRGIDEQAKAGGSSKQPENTLLSPGNGDFWEDLQAAALQAGDITPFAASVQVGDLQNNVTRAAEVGPGLHQRVYTSAYTLDAGSGKPVPAGQPPGEGISLNGVPGRHGATQTPCEQYFNYLGKYQPYGIYVPDAPGPYGLQLVLHGCSANHASKINQRAFQQKLGDAPNRILVSPLGRGPTGFYSDLSERDVLDVYDDAHANYAIDPEQRVVSGYSMGGYGAMRFAALYPDRWASVINWVGFSGDFTNSPLPGNPGPGHPLEILLYPAANARVGAVGNVIDFLGNLRNLPLVGIYSTGDYLVPLPTSLALQQRLGASPGVEYDFYEHTPAEHLTFIILDDWTKEADFSAGRRRVRDPAHITFRTDASLDYPEYAITHDRAWWLSGIVGRDAGYIDVDVKSLGCGIPEPQFADGNDAGSGPAPLTWLRQFRHVGGRTPVPAQNRVEATLGNVSALDVDANRACLAPGTAYHIVSDGPVTLNFSDGRVLSLPAGTSNGAI